MKSIRTDPRNHAAEGDERIRTAVPAPSTDPAYEADDLLRQLGTTLGHDDLTISCVGAFYVYEGHWTQISYRDEIGYGDTLVEALQDALVRKRSAC